jgi:hypothetical protein
MKDEQDGVTVTRVLFLSIGSYLIGSEYSAALGWGIWFITMAIN